MTEEGTVAWIVSSGLVPYRDAVAAMERRVDGIRNRRCSEAVWLLEHPPLYTAGTSTDMDDYRGCEDLPLHVVGRGGQLTYHGPGQRVVYVMLDLRNRGRDLRSFVSMLENWVIAALADLGITGMTRPDRVGIWIEGAAGNTGESKVAAIGLRLRGWISFHGISINIDPDLAHYRGIVPCGLPEFGVTSIRALGHDTTMAEFDTILKHRFAGIFNGAHREWRGERGHGGDIIA